MVFFPHNLGVGHGLFRPANESLGGIVAKGIVHINGVEFSQGFGRQKIRDGQERISVFGDTRKV